MKMKWNNFMSFMNEMKQWNEPCKHSICSVKRYINAEVICTKYKEDMKMIEVQIIHICQSKITAWANVRRFTRRNPFSY